MAPRMAAWLEIGQDAYDRLRRPLPRALQAPAKWNLTRLRPSSATRRPGSICRIRTARSYRGRELLRPPARTCAFHNGIRSPDRAPFDQRRRRQEKLHLSRAAFDRRPCLQEKSRFSGAAFARRRRGNLQVSRANALILRFFAWLGDPGLLRRP